MGTHDLLSPANHETLKRLQRVHGRDITLAMLVDAGVDRLPLPGAGQTLARWQTLAAVAAHDLSLVKLFEGHTDALAILAELDGGPPPAGSLWATWCAEPPDARLSIERSEGEAGVRLNGTKAWCSGAASVSHAVVSGWNAQGEPCLATVALQQPGVTVTSDGWHAVGMRASGSVDVRFDDAHAVLLGQPGDYTRRAGFWQGGAGIAACWFGGAAGIAGMARDRSRGSSDPHRLAHLGAIDVALAGAGSVLRESAARIDASPGADAFTTALRARLLVERAAQDVIQHAARALGAGPLCRDARFAQAMADLPVFLRQSHAERDLAALGAQALKTEEISWTL